MRVLYVTSGVAPHVLGGMQAVARMHVEGLARRSVDLAIVHSTGQEAVPKGDLPGREYPLAWPASRGIERWTPGHYVWELQRYSRLVAGIINGEKPDVVYAEGPLVHHSLMSAAESCPPVVFHPHGLEMFQDLGHWLQNLRSRPLRGIVRTHAQRSAIVISQGGKLTTILSRDCGTDLRNIRVLPNALNESELCERPRVLEGVARFLFVGRQEPRKGLPVLLRAMDQLPKAQLEIVGPPQPFTGSDKLATVVWHGAVRDRAALDRIFSRCHFLVLPSFAEGLPTVLLEAMARGLPVIASDVGAVSEIVRQPENGWLLEPGSASELAAVMQRAGELGAERYHAMSVAALATIRGRFLHEQVGDALLGVLGEAAAKGHE